MVDPFLETEEMTPRNDNETQRKMVIETQSRWRKWLVLSLVLSFCFFGMAAWCVATFFSGASIFAKGNRGTETHQDGEDESKTEAEEKSLESLEKELKGHVTHFAETIGERNLGKYDALCSAADFIEEKFKEGGYVVSRQTYKVKGLDCFNIAAEIKGTSSGDEIVIVGAHYDSVVGTPGANDNGSGTAVMLALADHFKDLKPKKTLRFVAFTNEEPPYFQNEGEMGSWVYADQCRKEDQDIVGIISLETMGYFTDEPESQKYPAPLNLMYPSTGNFLGFVCNLESREFQMQILNTFRKNSKVPSEGASLPASVPGVGWSDHWSFWEMGYPGIMVTDTAPFRYPHYHRRTDTPDKLDYETLAKVTKGLQPAVLELVGDSEAVDDKR